MQNQLLKIIGDILNLDASKLNLESKRGQFAEWDSLKHLQIIMAVEEELNISIPIEKVGDIEKIKDFLEFASK